MRRGILLISVVAALAVAPSASAAGWLPHPSDATWEYVWTDSVYNPTPTKEKVTVKSTAGSSFTLAWTTTGEGNPDAAPPEDGTASFQETQAGLVNTNWASTPPPDSFPVLCAQVSQCGNSLVGTLYNLIWGERQPVLLPEPLLDGTAWSSTGGATFDASADSTYLGTDTLTVPAFSKPVVAAKIQSTITQAGALGDPYGSGVRTVWWVYGVGPVKIVFEHTGGAVTTSELHSTNQKAKLPPPDTNYFPLELGLKSKYKWTNSKHLKKPVVVTAAIDQVSNSSARFSVSSVSGPIKLKAQFLYTLRLDGVTNIGGATQAQSLAGLPPLGPKSLPPAKRRHIFSPFDLMDWGFNPVLPAYPVAGQKWGSGPGRDFDVYGVSGHSVVLGVQKVKVPAGTFQAMAIRSVLWQRGFPFGGGVRTSWFAPGRGLVKLVFKHRDGSTSVVTLLH
ncbi:MAG: hypothetical protein ACRDLK_02215 [Gaiellaceae bacterium]